MRSRAGAVLSLLLLFPPALLAGELLCGTSAANDARLQALHERPGRERTRLTAHATAAPVLLRDGAFYLGDDDAISFGTRRFDLNGQSLVFEPQDQTRFAVRREPLRYAEPVGTFLHDFETPPVGSWHYRSYDLTRFTLPLFGESVTRLYFSAFNGVHLTPPGEVSAAQFTDLEAALYRQPLISPLLITNRKPKRLAYPKLFVTESDDALIVTWRSESGEAFGYDVQAELRKDGTIVYSYASMREMRWGAPVLSSGFDPGSVPSRVLAAVNDAPADLAAGHREALSPMLEIQRVELRRIDESELLKVRIQLAGPIDASALLNDETVVFVARVGTSEAWLEIGRSDWKITPFDQSAAVVHGDAARIIGNVIEIYGLQPAAHTSTNPALHVWSFGPSFKFGDLASVTVPFDPPARRIASDFSSLPNGSVIAAPVTEPFTLGALDVYEVWDRIQGAFALSSYAIDAVAIYQSFYSDIIFYAGAYAAGGNPQVAGIRPSSSQVGPLVSKAPTLLHMNQLTYGYNSATEPASLVLLHELGHRWLYFVSIREGEQVTRSLNPIGAHPAAYVHTPAAFPVYAEREASVMGGAYFTPLAAGQYQARVRSAGFSWMDLYLMGLAAPEEVEPWYYLANTVPALPQAYAPEDGVIVSGGRRDVTLEQVTSVHGMRDPSAGLSQKTFRVAFVLVTEGGEPTAEEIAKMNEWRSLLERDFVLATGGRGRVETRSSEPAKRRGVR
ncbi:MAG TPA: hypothetical protein VF701_06190 [Thermoanaerobaculia bacterium]